MNVILQTIRLQIRNSWVRPMFRFCLIVNPIMNTFFLYMMFLNSKETNFLAYVVFGSGLMALWGCICFSSIGDINRERYMGTLPLIYASPTSFGYIIFGKIVGNTILSMSAIVISYFTARIITRDRIQIGSPGYLVISLILAMISFSAIALCIAYLLMISRKTTLYMNLLEIPIIMLCGFSYPIEILPQWAQVIAKLIPITWVIKLIRMSISGVISVREYCKMFFISTISIVVCILFTWWLYIIIDRQIRVKATLEVS
ncbi:ABC transporter permease [Anaeromicropila herbilytica]|uniref:ABC-2 type transporter transmembrane domain-containing protein n=1 Tax=Anaeromicropila herbilytica TaxID=2785025 RepID=A0A7R7EN54_9FIRM|nr:ABC transporter permease [Anaeromicropila herbilytica]BCN31899.1 hypothetical protein bsdtb5_31940 [Anaeromicropila herbilytica]